MSSDPERENAIAAIADTEVFDNGDDGLDNMEEGETAAYVDNRQRLSDILQHEQLSLEEEDESSDGITNGHRAAGSSEAEIAQALEAETLPPSTH